MSEINNLNLNENNKIIEGFSPDIVQKATAVFNTLKKPLDITIKNLNSIAKSLKNSFKLKLIPFLKKNNNKTTNIFNKNEQKLLNQSMLYILLLKKIVIRICLLSLSYVFIIQKSKPQIITRSLKNENKKALLNFKLAAKIKQKAIVKALRDIKFGKIRAKKIPRKRNKNKKKKIIPKTEKILMNYSAVRKDQDKLRKIKLPTVKYESSPLKIAALCFAIYMVFSYIYFKL